MNIHIMAGNGAKSPNQIRFEMLINQLSTSVYSLAKQLKVSQSRIHRALEKQKGVDTELLEMLSKHYPEINMDWVVTGRGEMMLTHGAENIVSEPLEAYVRSYPIKVVHRHQFGQYAQNCLDNAFVRKLPTASTSAGDPGKFRDFEMNGPQMADSKGSGILEGDIVRGQHIQPDLYKSMLQPGQLVVVVTAEDILIRMVKQIIPGQLTLKSWSPLYEDEMIKLENVREIWLYRSLFTARDFKHKLYE